MIDALPYIDKDYESMEPQVSALIQEEMRTMGSVNVEDRIAHLPDASHFYSKLPLLSAEWERVESGKPLSAIDLSRYDIKQITSHDSKSKTSLQKAVRAMHTLSEHEQLTQINLELLDQYGAQAWQQANQNVENLIAQLDKETDVLRKEVTEINKKRKAEHVKAGKKSQTLEAHWVQLVNTTLQVELAISQLQAASKSS